ncbi:hypothetical protein CFR78_02310 [Komagataeibacter rhaeticus]|nr:hypothetical protein CT154_03770 [Komagataeibacter xylinus]EGG75335.1 hypothetical protein SXCC_03977 [Gluconacetobacter sp. SXCC-1]PYD54805.1 hypothetical protein CFR78_02310 [Komagataeibacter rhaeticus]
MSIFTGKTMFRIRLLLALCMLGTAINPTGAQSRTHRINMNIRPHSHTQVNTEMGHIRGYAPAMDSNGSAYRDIDAQCAAQGLGNVSSQSATVGVSLASRRNFYAQCMVQHGAWRQGQKN